MERSLRKVWRHEVPHIWLRCTVQQIADRLLAPQTGPAIPNWRFSHYGSGWALFSHCHHRTWGQEAAPGAAVFEDQKQGHNFLAP
jgi:hypothetical protein